MTLLILSLITLGIEAPALFRVYRCFAAGLLDSLTPLFDALAPLFNKTAALFLKRASLRSLYNSLRYKEL
jgi:hypothetical protein